MDNRTVAEALGLGTAKPPMVSPTGWSEHAELLRAEPEAYNAVVLHEIHFGALGRFAGLAPDSQPPPVLVAEETERNWGSWESYLLDLRLCCAASDHGWALTVWDDRRGRMRNAMVQGNGAVPAGCKVLLAIDTHEHAYVLDYGVGKHLGMAAQFENVDWTVVGQRLLAAMPVPPTLLITTPSQEPSTTSP
jgi:Fe-Mn family superoxide dismutase